MNREANTITISYHNKQTGQTMAATYEISALDENGACKSEMTLNWKDSEGKELTLKDSKQDPYGISDKFVRVLLGVSSASGVIDDDDDEEEEA